LGAKYGAKHGERETGAEMPNKPRDMQRVDGGRVLNGIAWVLRSDAPWRDLPARLRVLESEVRFVLTDSG